jgi:hypothetical protein
MAFNTELLGLFESEFGNSANLTTLSSDLAGKIVVIYGDNATGKTTVVSNLAKLGHNVIFIALENGLNAVSGVMNLKANQYSDLVKIKNKLTNKKFLEMLKKEDMIICWDGVENLQQLASKYVCSNLGVDKIGQANGGFGAWQDYNDAMRDIILPILNENYTNIFITHRGEIRDKKNNLLGYDIACDKRLSKILRDNADFILYVENQGIDEEGNELLSMAYSRPTENFYARSRFKYFPMEMEFTASNLINNLKEAVRLQAEEDNVDLVSSEEQKSVYGRECKQSFSELLEEVQNMLDKIPEEDEVAANKVFDLMDKTLGMGVSLKDLTSKNREALMVFREELIELFNG